MALHEKWNLLDEIFSVALVNWNHPSDQNPAIESAPKRKLENEQTIENCSKNRKAERRIDYRGEGTLAVEFQRGLCENVMY